MLASICGFCLVGAVLLIPTPAPASHILNPNVIQMAGLDDAVSMLTYNVSNKNHHIREVIPWLLEQDADVLTLQEVHVSASSRIIAGLADVYPYYAELIASVGYRESMTFSRFPIVATTPVQDLETLHTQLCIQGHPVDLFNVSLATPVRDFEPSGGPFNVLNYGLNYDDSIRDAQVAELVTLLEPYTAPLIVAGDFNLTPETGSYRALTARLTDSYAMAGAGASATWPIAEEYDLPSFIPPLLRIDYVFHNAAFEAQYASVARGIGSDHLSLMALLRFTDAAAASSCMPDSTIS